MIDLNDESTKFRAKMLANGTVATIVTGIFLGRAPQGQVYPYISFFPVGGAPLHTQGTEDVEKHLWQVDLWSTSLMTLNRLQRQVAISLDGVTLGLATLTEIAVFRDSILPLDIEMEDESGPVYHQPMQYQIWSR